MAPRARSGTNPNANPNPNPNSSPNPNPNPNPNPTLPLPLTLTLNRYYKATYGAGGEATAADPSVNHLVFGPGADGAKVSEA